MLRLMLVGLLLCITAIGCQRLVTVSSGTKVVCSECGKTITADIQTLQVPTQEAPKYSVHETMKICPACQAKIAEQKRQEEARQRAEAAKQEKQRRIESRGKLAGIWRGSWNGYDMHLCFREDGTGFFQLSSFAGGSSYNILWKVNGNSIKIDVLPSSKNEDINSDQGLSGTFQLQGDSLSINHKNGGWTVYSRQ